jgi:hypothetical protein
LLFCPAISGLSCITRSLHVKSYGPVCITSLSLARTSALQLERRGFEYFAKAIPHLRFLSKPFITELAESLFGCYQS